MVTTHSIDTTAPTTVFSRRPPTNRTRDGLLDADEIAGVAVGVADAEGLVAASVKRVATRLRVPSNRLEQYVTSRDELQDLMLDHLLGRIALPDPQLAWSSQLTQLARGLHGLARDHRCLVDLIAARSPSGPHGLRLVEHALAAFATTGTDVRTAALSFNAVLSYVCGAVSSETRPGGPTRQRDAHAAGRAGYLSRVVADGTHPRLRELFATAADITSDESFDHGLACLLAGIADRVTGPLVAGTVGAGVSGSR